MPSNKLVGPNQRWVVKGLVNTMHVYTCDLACVCVIVAVPLAWRFISEFIYCIHIEHMTVGHTVIHVQEGGVHCPHVSVIYSPTRERERERHRVDHNITTTIHNVLYIKRVLLILYIYIYEVYFATSFVEPCRQWLLHEFGSLESWQISSLDI